MRVVINQTLLARLPARSTDLRDAKLTGFMIRCRPSGEHSYLMQLGRGQIHTIGRVRTMTVAAARAAAETLRGTLNQAALAERLEDAALTMAQARHKARATVRTRRAELGASATWGAFLAETYAPWARVHLKTGDKNVRRLTVNFAGFHAVRLRDLAPFAIERWRTARLKTGVTSSTVNRNLAAFRGALTKARQWHLLDVHPMAEIKGAKLDAIGHLRYLTPAETARLEAALQARDDRRRAARDSANAWRRGRQYVELPPFGAYTDHLIPLVTLARYTGLRRGELFQLQWRDVDLVAALLTVRGAGAKSGKTRVLPLNLPVVTMLRQWRPAQPEATAYVFPSTDGGPLSDLKTSFLKVLKAAQIPDFRFHDLRHDFASKLVMAGVDLNTVRELLGHANITMTLRYAHLAPEHKAAAVAKLL